MNVKTKFCLSLDWNMEFSWYDLAGFHQMKNGNIAKIELHEYGTMGTYPGFRVQIISKKSGIVDSKFFEFDDYLDRKENRVDDQDDYPNSPRNGCFMVISHCGWKWYIAEPKTTRPFCEAIESYISNFDSI